MNKIKDNALSGVKIIPARHFYSRSVDYYDNQSPVIPALFGENQRTVEGVTVPTGYHQIAPQTVVLVQHYCRNETLKRLLRALFRKIGYHLEVMSLAQAKQPAARPHLYIVDCDAPLDPVASCLEDVYYLAARGEVIIMMDAPGDLLTVYRERCSWHGITVEQRSFVLTGSGQQTLVDALTPYFPEADLKQALWNLTFQEVCGLPTGKKAQDE